MSDSVVILVTFKHSIITVIWEKCLNQTVPAYISWWQVLVNSATSSSTRIHWFAGEVSCGIEILVYNGLLLILPADIHGGLVSSLWFWAFQLSISQNILTGPYLLLGIYNYPLWVTSGGRWSVDGYISQQNSYQWNGDSRSWSGECFPHNSWTAIVSSTANTKQFWFLKW